MLKSLPPTLLLVAVLAACGGDDSDSDAGSISTPTTDAITAPTTTWPTTTAPTTTAPTTTEPTTTDPITEPTVTDPLDDPEFLNLVAWCLGWHEGASIDLGGDAAAEANAITELFIETDAVVPDEIAQAWDTYTSGTDTEGTEYRVAYREIDQFWLANCAEHVTIGSKITQP